MEKTSISGLPDGGLRVPGVRRVINSFFRATTPTARPRPGRTAVVALVAGVQDRHILTSVSCQEPFDLHFTQSSNEACEAAKRLTAPVVLLDRDWPDTEWRVNVQSLAALPHRACVVLLSKVSDGPLLLELSRRGGYDILCKPLRAADTARVLRLALSYWNSARKSAARA